MSEPKSWSDLEKHQAAAPKDDRVAELCAEIFTGPAGKELLALWRKRWFDLGDNPLAHPDGLRVRAATQHFINEIDRARDRGLKPKA